MAVTCVVCDADLIDDDIYPECESCHNLVCDNPVCYDEGYGLCQNCVELDEEDAEEGWGHDGEAEEAEEL